MTRSPLTDRNSTIRPYPTSWCLNSSEKRLSGPASISPSLPGRTGLTRDNISRYATGRTSIPDSKLILIAQALETQPSRIVPKRKNLDGIPPRGPDDPEFTIRPSRTPGLVRLEIAADIDLETATKIVAMVTKKKPYDEDD